MAAGRREKQAEDDLFDWFTISYRSIYTVLGAIVLLGGGFGIYWWLTHQPPVVTVETPAPTATSARFTTIEGSVKVKPVGQFDWFSGDRSMVLRKGDLVRTGTGSAAEIQFFDGTVVHVRPDSLITIEETTEDPSSKARKVAWFISSGGATFQTARKNVPGSETKVSTPTVQGTVGELTSAEVRVAEAGDSDFRLFKGSGQVTTKSGQTVALARNEAIKVDASGRAGEKVALPGVPRLLAPSHQAEITYPNAANATTALVWEPVQRAVAYHVMLDYSAYFNRPMVDRRNIADTSVHLTSLSTGKYYWRVAAIDRNGEEGAFSDFARFTVATAGAGGAGDGPPPPLVIQTLEVRQSILQLKGRTEPGASLTVNGQRVDVEADGSFNDFITLEKPGKQDVVVRATGLNGGVREVKRPVVVGF